MTTIPIAVIPGDGVGKEVTPHGVQVLKLISELDGSLNFDFTVLDWGTEYYLKNGKMMPDDGISVLQSFEGILLGAVGLPKQVPDHVTLWGLLIPIRQELQQYVNVRPAKRFHNVPSPIVSEAFDFVVVRENSEGEYSELGGRSGHGPDELALQTAIFTRKGITRAMEYAFTLASQRRSSVTSATKSNGIVHSMPFWDEVFKDIAQRHNMVSTRSTHIDALAAFLVTKPQMFDVIVASNLFGDILTDIGAAIMGSIGMAPSANLNPERKYPSMFEPVHGSAPDIMGKGIANPIGTLWSAKMLLDFFGYAEWGQLLLDSIDEALSRSVMTKDIGGIATTGEAATEVMNILCEKANR